MSSYICGKCGTEVRGYDGCPGCKALAFQERMANAAEQQYSNNYNNAPRTEYVYMSKSETTIVRVLAAIVFAVCLIPFAGGIQTSGFGAVVQLLAFLIGAQAFIKIIE